MAFCIVQEKVGTWDFLEQVGRKFRQLLDQSDPRCAFAVHKYCNNDRRTNGLLALTQENARCQGTSIPSGLNAGLSAPLRACRREGAPRQLAYSLPSPSVSSLCKGPIDSICTAGIERTLLRCSDSLPTTRAPNRQLFKRVRRRQPFS